MAIIHQTAVKWPAVVGQDGWTPVKQRPFPILKFAITLILCRSLHWSHIYIFFNCLILLRNLFRFFFETFFVFSFRKNQFCFHIFFEKIFEQMFQQFVTFDSLQEFALVPRGDNLFSVCLPQMAVAHVLLQQDRLQVNSTSKYDGMGMTRNRTQMKRRICADPYPKKSESQTPPKVILCANWN